MNFLAIAAFVNFVSSAALGIIAFYRCPNKQLGRGYGILNAWISFWSFSFFLTRIVTSAEKAMVVWQIVAIGIIWINQAFLSFSLTFLKQIDRFRLLLRAIATLNVIFSILVLSKILFQSVAQKFAFGYWPVSTPWAAVYVAFWHAELFFAFGLLVAGLRYSQGIRREQLKYMITAFSIGYFGGGLAWLPWFDINFPPHSIILVSVYSAIVAYAILKHQLMDISVVVKKTLVYSIVSTTLASLYVGTMTLLARLLEIRSPDDSALSSAISAGRYSLQWLKSAAQGSFAYFCILNSILSIGFGVFVWAQGRSKAANRLWFWMCMSVAAWSLGLGMMVRSQTLPEAYFWQTWFLYAGACVIPTVFLHFVSVVSERPMRNVLLAAYLWGLGELLFDVTGHLATVTPKPPFNFYTSPYPIYQSYFIYFMLVTTYAHVLLAKRFLDGTGRLKEQIRYIAVGTAIGFCGGATTFLYAFDIPIFPYGAYLVPIYIITVSYAIFKHRLMDINVVIRRTLVYSALSAVLACAYVTTITLLAYVLGTHKGSVSPFTSAVAAAAITLMFNPLRVRFQRIVDRHFMREALDQNLLREATSGFVHEIKRPLANISLPAELSLADLKEVNEDRRAFKEVFPKIQQRLQYILDQTTDAGNKIEAIREFSSSNGAHLEELSLPDIIRKSICIEESLLSRHRIDLNLEISDDLPLMKGHPKQLEIVFCNLIKNAAEAMSKMDPVQPKKLWVKALLAEGKVTVSVKDNGPGIKKTIMPHLFEPYFTTKGTHGMGMGLYLCRQIVQMHHGSIEVTSNEGVETTFLIRLFKNANGKVT